jgi:hypothetical protein
VSSDWSLASTPQRQAGAPVLQRAGAGSKRAHVRAGRGQKGDGLTFGATRKTGHLVAAPAGSPAAPAGSSEKTSVATETVNQVVEPVKDVVETVQETATGVVGSLPVEVPPVQVPPVPVPEVPPVKLP